MTRKMIWAVADLVFQNHRDYLAAADVLAAHDYEVVYRPERIDPYSGAAFADAYKLIAADQLDTLWDAIDRLIDPFDGECSELGEADESS